MNHCQRRTFIKTAIGGTVATVASSSFAAQTQTVPTHWDETVNLLIIGSGGAGLATAVSAAEHGLKNILILEKMAYLGGNTAISGGGFNAVDPKRQQRQGIEDSPALHAEQTLKGGDYRGNPELVQVLAENAGDTVAWLEKMGVGFKDNVSQIYGALYPRTHSTITPFGSSYIKVLSRQCESLGVEIRKNARVTRVVRTQPLEGDVLGVVYEDAKKQLHTVKATLAVVVATGGFSANAKMCAIHDPRLANLGTTNHPGATGDLIPLLQNIGAEVTGMDYIQCLPSAPPGRKHRVIFHMFPCNLVMVNIHGERFIAEDERRDVIRDAYLAQPEQRGFSIIDQNGFDQLNPGHQQSGLKGLETGDAWKADTIEELAVKLNLDPNKLRRTIDAYNASVDSKKDPLGKNPRNLNAKIAHPPFWAGNAGMGIHHTMGGIVIDKNTRVIDRSGNVIPRLHAVGEVAGGIHGTNRLGGNAIADIFTFGRLTGLYIAGLK